MDSELEMTDKAVAAVAHAFSQIESRLNAYGVPEVRGEYTDRRPQFQGMGEMVSLEDMKELRAAYLELRRPPWNKHSEKMVRLYSAIEAVLGTPESVGVVDDLPGVESRMIDQVAGEQSRVGIDFGVGIAVYGGATEPDGVIIGRNSEEVECNNRHCEHQITGAFGGHCLRSTCDNWRHNCPRHQAIIGEG